jgi:hypothetical protein
MKFIKVKKRSGGRLKKQKLHKKESEYKNLDPTTRGLNSVGSYG